MTDGVNSLPRSAARTASRPIRPNPTTAIFDISSPEPLGIVWRNRNGGPPYDLLFGCTSRVRAADCGLHRVSTGRRAGVLQHAQPFPVAVALTAGDTDLWLV